MTRCLLVWTMVLLSLTRSVAAQPYENVGAAIADLPDVALWHFKVFVVAPDNFRRFAADLETERDKLGPGEEKKFEVLFQKDPAGQPLRYKGLHPAGEDRLSPLDVISVGEIVVRKASLVQLLPMPLLSRKDFQAMQEHAAGPTAIRVLEYEDVVFSINAHNRLSGFEIDYSDNQTVTATAPVAEWINLLDPVARATADGRVILVSVAGDDAYQVFNLDTGKTESYNKGAAMRQRGTMVYVLSEFAGRKYVTAYRGMEATSAKPGDTVRAGQQIGFLRPQPVDAARACIIPKPETDPEVAIYRVNRKDQYYLANLSKTPEARLLFSR